MAYLIGGCGLSNLNQGIVRNKEVTSVTTLCSPLKKRVIVNMSPGGGGGTINTRPLTGQMYPRGR